MPPTAQAAAERAEAALAEAQAREQDALGPP